MTVREIGHGSHRYVWDTADTKPTATTHGCSVGDTGYDRQTGIMYITYDGTNWVEKDTIVRLETSPTIDIGDVQIHDSAGSEVLGTLTASPTAYSIGARIKETVDGIDELKVLIGAVTGSPTENTLLERLKVLEANLDALTKAEDAAHSSGDSGTMALGVRKDVPGTLASADGDYTPNQYDQYGSKRVVSTNPMFGEPLLAHAKNSRAYWARNTADPNYHPSGTGWKACLHGRVQTGDDWAAIVIPVNEMPVPDFSTAKWQYVMSSAQSMGVNIVFWCHDPDNFIYRAEITQDATNALVTKTSGRNAHVFNTATTQMFYYGEITGTPDTCPTAGTKYTWAEFQTDSVFSGYTIYKITIEMGWQASGTFDHVFIGDLNLNGTNILLKPRTEADLEPIHDIQANTSAVAITVAPKTPFQLLSIDLHTNQIPKTGENLTITKDAGGDGLALAGYLDTIILSEDLFVGSRVDYHAAFGEGYEFSEDDELDIAQTNGDGDQTGTDVCWKPI